MSNVLVVDDEQHYRDHLSAALSRDGHEVKTAAGGREAIALGCRFRPDVLIVDWLLKNHIHGLSVSQALQAVLPDLRTIVITGFPSSELRDSAEEAGVQEFIEKPFDLQRMRAAVRNVRSRAPARHSRPSLALVELAGDGTILHANRAAKEMLAESPAGREARHLNEVFSEKNMPDLDAAVDRWIVAAPRAGRSIVWHVRAQPFNQWSRLVILRRQNEPQYAGLALVEMVLGVVERKCVRWPFSERVLVVDGDAVGRRTSIGMLESTAATCYGVARLADALPLLESDDGLGFVLLDFETTDDIAGAVAALRRIRPTAVLLGMSMENRRGEFAAAGVQHFLRKPWRPDHLINVLTGRLADCAECGLRLPLRQAGPDESPASWACGFCGAGYQGLLDESTPPDVLGNVRAID